MNAKEYNFDAFDTDETNGVAGSAIGAIDLSDVPDQLQYEVLPAGIYRATVDSVEFGYSQRSGNPMLTWTFKLHLADGRERTQFYHTVLTDQGLPRLKRTIMRLAPFANEEVNLRAFQPEDAGVLFTGTPCRVRLRIQNYEGQQRNSISDVLPPDEADVAQAGDGFMS